MPQGEDFRLSSMTVDDQRYPSIGISGNGSWIVAWQSDVRGSGDSNIFARWFSASGAPLGDEFLCNTATSGRREYPVVAVALGGHAIVGWNGKESGNDSGLFVRISSGTQGATVPK
jgi:hypothetical protein